MFKNDLALRLRALRTKHGLTQLELSKRIGVTRSTYTYYENGKTEPSLETIIAISKVYKISTDDILINKNTKKARG